MSVIIIYTLSFTCGFLVGAALFLLLDFATRPRPHRPIDTTLYVWPQATREAANTIVGLDEDYADMTPMGDKETRH